jgi:hypothetical protein
MTPQEQLVELEGLAKELDVQVCYEPMAGLVQGVGGLCRVKGQYRIIVDRRLQPPERIAIVADALKRFDQADAKLSALLGKQPVEREIARETA